MIKINKNLDNIPESLNSQITNQRRNELIENGKYVYERKYDERYKADDVKSILESIYHKKCAYCEKNVGDSYYHIEHYRPKSIYYWIAYSWDNLLLCCDKCNVNKGDNFKTEGEKATFNQESFGDIHKLSQQYNEIEKPKMIHPEFEDVESKLIFDEKGNIKSEDERVQYTIKTCKLDRTSANDSRKKILDDLKRKHNCKQFEYKFKNDDERNGAIKGLIFAFKEDSENPENDYLAFRRWIIRNLRYLMSLGDKQT